MLRCAFPSLLEGVEALDDTLDKIYGHHEIENPYHSGLSKACVEVEVATCEEFSSKYGFLHILQHTHECPSWGRTHAKASKISDHP